MSAATAAKDGTASRPCSKPNNKQESLVEQLLPLVVSVVFLQGLSYVPFVDKQSPDGRVLFSFLCYIGGTALVEAAESAMTVIWGVDVEAGAHPAAEFVGQAIDHLRAKATGYMASFVIVLILQRVREQTQDNNPYLSALACIGVLFLGLLLPFIAKGVGTAIVQHRHGLDNPPDSKKASKKAPKHGWKVVKGVLLALSITTVVLTGGGTIVILVGVTQAVAAAANDAEIHKKPPKDLRERIMRFFVHNKAAPSSDKGVPAKDFSVLVTSKLEHISWHGFFTFMGSAQSRVLCSPVILPTVLVWMTYITICSWPKGCTDGLAFVLTVLEAAICTTHLIPSLFDASTQSNGAGRSTKSRGSKVFECFWFFVAWMILLWCFVIVFGLKENLGETMAVFVVVTIVALRTRREDTWRGLIAVFWLVLLVLLVLVAWFWLGKMYHAHQAMVCPLYRPKCFMELLKLKQQLNNEFSVCNGH